MKKQKVSVWVFDDLWEEGYRFDDKISKRYCFVERKFANNESEALDFLQKAFEHIPKIQGTSNRMSIESQISEQIIGKTHSLIMIEK